MEEKQPEFQGTAIDQENRSGGPALCCRLARLTFDHRLDESIASASLGGLRRAWEFGAGWLAICWRDAGKETSNDPELSNSYGVHKFGNSLPVHAGVLATWKAPHVSIDASIDLSPR